ncbi:kinase-like domain-containing protein, partial [Mycena leptocephala]
ARHFLNWLAAHLKQLPDDISISGIVLMTEHPVNHGGFSNIYFGRYENSESFQTEVALKVLKIFENQTADDRVLLHRKFVKEVLVWRFLRHENIIPLLGVFQTASLPSLAMVSPWMPRGSVLKYMADHSPSSTYAMSLLNDVIQGLMYLHSQNVVHGDLCGRNILIDHDGHARLTDFGLAAF